jgi:hypothetical protein
MYSRFSILFLIAALFFGTLTLGDANAQRMSREAAVTEVGENIPEKELLRRLKKGGLVLLIRHGYTDHSQSDARARDHSDCSIQRNLDDKGKRGSREMGAAIKKLGIPVGGIFASPKCRTRDTALEAFGRVENLGFLFINHGGAKDQRRDFFWYHSYKTAKMSSLFLMAPASKSWSGLNADHLDLGAEKFRKAMQSFCSPWATVNLNS